MEERQLMYNDTPTTPFTRRNILLVTGIVALIAIIVFVVTHGFLIVENVTNNEPYRHTSYSSDLTPTSSGSTGSFNLLTSGNYSLEMSTSDSGIDTKFITVPRFFTTTTTKRESGEKKVEVLGRGVMARLASAQSGLIAWNESGDYYPINQGRIDNSDAVEQTSGVYPDFEQVVQVNGSLLGGFTRNDDGSIFPTFHNLSISDNSIFQPFTPGESVVVKREVGGFSIYDSNSETFLLYRPGEEGPLSFKQEVDSVATYDRTPLYSIGTKRTAIVTGGDITSSNEDEDVKSTDASFRVRIFNTSDKKQLVDKSLEASIKDLSLSPEGNYLYVHTDRSMVIYETKSLTPVYASPFLVNDFMWINNDSFTFTTAEQGMFIGSAKSSSARTVASFRVVRPTQLSYINDGWIYFTAYTDQNDGAINPDAYRVSIKDAASDRDKTVLREFPHKGDGYYIDFINGRLVVQLTRYIDSTGSFEDEEAKLAVNSFVADFFPDEAPEIVYDYIISDLRPQTNLEE